jgi:hypothetical protein
MRRIFEIRLTRLVSTFFAGLLVFSLVRSNQVWFAQTAAGSIVGIVRDHTGNVVPGAQVTVINRATNQRTHFPRGLSTQPEAPKAWPPSSVSR